MKLGNSDTMIRVKVRVRGIQNRVRVRVREGATCSSNVACLASLAPR